MCHRKLSVLFVLAIVFIDGLATSIPSPWGEMLEKHKWIHIPDNWDTLGHPPDGTTIDLHIALKPERKNALVDALLEVSQPRHPKYGAHLSKSQVAQLVAPHPDTLKLVSSWLVYNGVPPSSISTTLGGCWLTVSGLPVSQANKLLGASYKLFYHSGTNETILRTAGYALPAGLHIHIQTVAPTTAFASTHFLQHEAPRRRSGGTAEQAVNATSGEPVNMPSRREAEDDRYIRPSNLRWLYHTATYQTLSEDRNKLGIVGYKNQIPNPVDLATFLHTFRSDALGTLPTFEPVDDRYWGQPGMQANLDLQYAMALAHPTPVIYYTGTGNGVQIQEDKKPAFGDQYIQWLNYITAKDSMPQTIAIGFGTPEPTVPREYAEAICAMFAQFGVRGSSVLAASGDLGVGPTDCTDINGQIQFFASFPASCPWVTGVGGTKQRNLDSFEQVANSLSGGGFSTYFSRESYQEGPVTSYFGELELRELGQQNAGYYNPHGRGVPDISMESGKYLVVYIGLGFSDIDTYWGSGTGPSTITAAAFFALLNDYVMSKGKASLGFLNPLLYGDLRLGFTDIEVGSNPGCGTPGFPAAPGWDPVTGLGTMDFLKLQNQIDFIKKFLKDAPPPVQPPQQT